MNCLVVCGLRYNFNFRHKLRQFYQVFRVESIFILFPIVLFNFDQVEHITVLEPSICGFCIDRNFAFPLEINC